MFRKEAIQAKRQKLHGDVFLIQPVPFSALGLVILSIVVTTLLILLRGDYARSEHVIGHLVPSTGLVKIQTPRSGILESINVKESQIIKSGQKLAAVLVSTSALDGSSVADKSIAALTRQENELQIQIALETNQLEANTARLSSEKEALVSNVHSLEGQLALQKQLTSLAEDSYQAVQNLLIKGYISKEKSKERRQAWVTQKAYEKLKDQELSAAESNKRQLEIRLLQLPNESKQRIARLKALQAELEGRKTELKGRSAYSIA